eukprot:CAMPEP_0114109808 /NCGR_PEP_ID=MMETSP0043_2-20121206/970_1 /TAXON_ID=464988 /ORGANISM="Hemiselmis andersenii, Strain CCMP644" /LENGTH=297 /DNA_ID=CAMNT_0001201703 /DNA_START=741 /DNA_END=1633 /DNA_ORIENTATION=+
MRGEYALALPDVTLRLHAPPPAMPRGSASGSDEPTRYPPRASSKPCSTHLSGGERAPQASSQDCPRPPSTHLGAPSRGFASPLSSPALTKLLSNQPDLSRHVAYSRWQHAVVPRLQVQLLRGSACPSTEASGHSNPSSTSQREEHPSEGSLLPSSHASAPTLEPVPADGLAHPPVPGETGAALTRERPRCVYAEGIGMTVVRLSKEPSALIGVNAAPRSLCRLSLSRRPYWACGASNRANLPCVRTDWAWLALHLSVKGCEVAKGAREARHKSLVAPKRPREALLVGQPPLKPLRPR